MVMLVEYIFAVQFVIGEVTHDINAEVWAFPSQIDSVWLLLERASAKEKL